jgi:hypothetical protein
VANGPVCRSVGLAPLVPVEERLHRFFPSKAHPQAEASIDSISSRRCLIARRARSAELRASTSIRGRSESPSRSMVWQDRRPGAQLRLPLQPAIARRGRDRGRLNPLVSVRYRERFASRVEHRPRSQDLESADSTRVAMCAALAGPPPSGFPRRQPQRSNEDIVIPFLPHAWEASMPA